MKIPFLDAYLRYRTRTAVRNGMRGYRLLKDSGRLAFVFELKEEITNTPLFTRRDEGRFSFFGAAAAEAELVTRQFLLTRVLSYDFNKKILAALGNGTRRVTHPLPRPWRKVLEQHGFRADTNGNHFLWIGYLLLYWLFGAKIIFSFLFEGVKSIIRGTYPKACDYAYFDSLSAANLPPAGVSSSQDIFHWYHQWPNRASHIDRLCHGIPKALDTSVDVIPVVSVPSAIPVLASVKKIGLFAVWSIRAASQGLAGLITGDYHYALLLSEAAKAAKLRLADPKTVARDYLFHNAHWIYRPLWTYDAEQAGARILFYFYSTNIEGFKLPRQKQIQANSWQIASWPHYLVWDRWQADFIRNTVSREKKIEVTGPIWFSQGMAAALPVTENYVVVFDINPLRDARYYMFAEPVEYLVPAVVNHFLLDIYAASSDLGLHMVLKRKRDIGNLLHVSYKKILDQLASQKNFSLINMETSVIQLVEVSSMVISLPFTSTALIGRELGKPSCYYDPSGLVQADDPAAHGIPVLSGPSALAKWMKEMIAASEHSSPAKEIRP